MGRHSRPEDLTPEEQYEQAAQQYHNPDGSNGEQHGFDAAYYTWDQPGQQPQHRWYGGGDPAHGIHQGHPVVTGHIVPSANTPASQPDSRPAPAWRQPGLDEEDDPFWGGSADPDAEAFDEDEDEGLGGKVQRREAADADADTGDEPLARGAEKGKAKKEKKPPTKFRVGAAIGGVVLAALCWGNFTETKSDDNTREHGMPTVTSGPNMIPSQPMEGEPMDKPEQRLAHVQRAVNNGEYEGEAAQLQVLPGVLAYKSTGGEAVQVANPIIVTDGLGSNITDISSVNTALQGHIFSIEPASVNETGVSYQVTSIDPTTITGFKWAKGVDHSEGSLPVIEARAGWTKENAGIAIDTDSKDAYRQAKNGRVIEPGEDGKGAPMPLAQEIG